MINKSEIEAKAQEFAIHTSNVQRDYVFGWVLSGIYAADSLRDLFILKGGNCLRKAYFEHSRFSRDLDLSTTTPLAADFIGSGLNHICDLVQSKTGVFFEKEKTRVEKKKGVDPDKSIYEARLYFKDFYGNAEHITISIRLDITQFDKIFLSIQKRNLIHPYSDIEDCCVPIRCIKLEEILACKLKCLLQRRHSADLYDFVCSTFLNPSIDLNKAEIVETFLKMTIFRRSPGIVKGLFFDLPFQIIKGLWHKYLAFPKQGFIAFDKGVDSFKDTIDDLFGALPVRGGEQYFFPSHLRNPIMEAGYSMTMLEMIYDDVKRLVEPYSLAYKTRKDGVAREYFYAYDVTGSHRSGPSLKKFVHPKIQQIQNTDKKFEPRYEVELYKAGEPLKDSYFARPSGRTSTSRRGSKPRIRRPSTSLMSTKQYSIQCPICGRKFRRKTSSTMLNPHKDRYGNRCYGKSGFRV